MRQVKIQQPARWAHGICVPFQRLSTTLVEGTGEAAHQEVFPIPSPHRRLDGTRTRYVWVSVSTEGRSSLMAKTRKGRLHGRWFGQGSRCRYAGRESGGLDEQQTNSPRVNRPQELDPAVQHYFIRGHHFPPYKPLSLGRYWSIYSPRP